MLDDIKEALDEVLENQFDEIKFIIKSCITEKCEGKFDPSWVASLLIFEAVEIICECSIDPSKDVKDFLVSGGKYAKRKLELQKAMINDEE